jgi:hypothetical protein
LYTKQHYVADVIAGTLLALAAYVIFLKNCPNESPPPLERRLAPLLALAVMGIVALGVATFWVLYQLNGWA